MQNPLRRITLIFILVALLPIGFIFYELNSLTDHERIIRESYTNQLDAILFSVNQYSDDVINSWANRLALAATREDYKNDTINTMESLMNQFGSVQFVYFTDLAKTSLVYGMKKDGKQNSQLQIKLDSLVKANRQRVDRLITYEEAGFRKMELMDTIHINKPVPVFFVLNEGSSAYRLGAMMIDLPQFIENTLGPKMQAIAQDKFIISAYRADSDSLMYSTNVEAVGSSMAVNDQSPKKSFWLLPGYYVSISLTGTTINDLVKDRMMTSIIILVILAFVLGVGIFFLNRNIRREMHLAQAKSEFVSNVSHEIRTPLSLINMYAETLEMNRVSEEKKLEYQQVIAKESARLSGIVNRILNFSQAQANKKVYEFKPVQLNDMIDNVLHSYHFHLKEKGFIVEFLKDDTLNKVLGDYESITEAFINLLDNAIKYSTDKRNIRIATGTDGKWAFVEVKDEGIGIAKKYHTEIFDQFYRAPTGDVHSTKGSGLGLTLVKKTMDAHGGKIKVESVPGKGSSFRLYFPFKKDISS